MADFLKKLSNFLKRLRNEGHTGEVVIRLILNQGGLRSYKLIKEKPENI